MGALVGGRIVGVRYCCGSVLVRIQDLLLDEGFSTFWAAVIFTLACFFSHGKVAWYGELTPPLANSNLLLPR